MGLQKMGLQKIGNGVVIPPSGWNVPNVKRQTHNLWLILTDGMIPCGRNN